MLKPYIKRVVSIISFCIFAMLISSFFSACKTGYGCPATENYQIQSNKRGELSTTRGSSRLSEKPQRRGATRKKTDNKGK